MSMSRMTIDGLGSPLAKGTATMVSRLVGAAVAAVLALAMAVVAAIAAPAQPSPKAFVEAIYKAYLGRNAKGVPLTDETSIRRYFAPPLADAMVKDRAEADKAGEAPTLDGDPFVDAQDFEIARLAVNVTAAGTDAASARVTFTNFRKPVTMTLSLVKVGNAWRIAEIRSPSGSLRELMKVK
jgi:hypothetical protein